MAHYQNGHQSYYGQPNTPRQPPPQSLPQPHPSQYASHAPVHRLPPMPEQQQSGLRRMPSYNAGDDAEFFDESRTQNRGVPSGGNMGYPGQSIQGRGGAAYSAYGGSVNANNGSNRVGSGRSQYSTGSSGQSAPSRASSHASSALSGYQHQYQQPPPTPSQPTYNPQQFAQSQPQPPVQSGYNPQAYGAVSANQYGTTTPHQAYNPAAYPATTPTVHRNPTTASQYSLHSPIHYGMPSLPQQPPQPPPRPHDHPYGARQSTQYPDSSPDPQYGFSPASNSPQPTGTSPVPPPRTSPLPQPSTTAYTDAAQAYTARRYSRGAQTASYSPNPPAHADPPVTSPSRSQFADVNSYSTRTNSISSTAQPPYPQPQGTPRRTDTLGRHPQSRPLPGPPPEADSAPSHSTFQNGHQRTPQSQEEVAGYEELMKEVEAAVMEGRPASTRRQNSQASSRFGYQEPIQEAEEPAPLFTSGSGSTQPRISPDEKHTHTNGNISTGTGHYVNYEAYSDDEEAEAAAGVMALKMAEEEEAAQMNQGRARHNTNASLFSGYSPRIPEASRTSTRPGTGNTSDYQHRNAGFYGSTEIPGAPTQDETAPSYGDGDSHHRVTGSSGSFEASTGRGSRANSGAPEQDTPYPFPVFGMAARVDTGGTGGLSQPSPHRRRMSFEEDEETSINPEDEDRSRSESPEKGEPQELFFHPGMSSRPLPPAPVEPVENNVVPYLMPAGTYRNRKSRDMEQYDQYRGQTCPTSPDNLDQSNLSPSAVPRSTSLSSHSSTPRTDPPIRSKTDADRAKLRQLQQQQYMSGRSSSDFPYEPSFTPDAMGIDLPVIPPGRRKKFNPSKLSSEQFNRCTEPWALSSIIAWVKDLSEDENDLREHMIVEAIVALFTHKVPTMNTADAESLGDRVVKDMLAGGSLIKEEEWVKFGTETLTGVLWQITGTGCYSSRLHLQETDFEGRCYSYHCMRTLKKVNLQAHMMEPQQKAQDWVTFYKVEKDVWEAYPKQEIARQNNLHEIVTTEDSYIAQLDVLRMLYRDQLRTMEPPVIGPKRIDRFLNDVFGKVDAVKKANEDFLLAQLKYRQKEQGPFIAGFSDIFREWIRKAKAVYIDYAATFPNANYLVRRESEKNALFKQFLNQARENKQSQRLSWDTYLKAPITRIQRYGLLLSTVHKNMPKDSEEKTNLQHAIEEIRVVALECDNKVGEMTKKVDLLELGSKLKLRPEMKKEVELNLEHLGREIIFQGDLQRPGNRTRFNWVDTHAILFDHFLVLAKTVVSRDPTRTLKSDSYDVSKLPIPMGLLVLESTNDDPVVKSSVKGIATVAPAPTRGGASSVTATITHTGTNNSLASVNSASSGRTMIPTTVLENPKDEKILYPFRIKHLGKPDIYTLYAPSAQNRQDWCDKIIEAKTKHAASLYAQNAEPFRLRVLADTAFAYNEQTGSPGNVRIKGTPLDRAIRDVETQYSKETRRPLPICRAAVNCATVFCQPPGRLMCAVGTDYGIYISPYNDPRGWNRAVPIMRVTQIAVFEEFNLFLVIADKSLIAYHLDVVCPVSGSASQNDSSRRAPQKLSGTREVSFFATGRIKDRTLVLYKKREGISSTFKVLEPVLQKSTSSRSRFIPTRRGNTEFFREYDEFYIPTESYGINLFHSSLAISTSRGVEVLTLDKKQPWSVPNLRSDQADVQAHLSTIADRIEKLRPLGMFRLSESEFLVAFEECAVYVNKHGDVSRSVVMEFVGRAKSACLFGKFLILFDEDFVEVRNAMNGRMRQVISGKNVTCLDDGGNLFGNANSSAGGASASNATAGANYFASGSNGPVGGGTNGLAGGYGSTARTVKFVMQHPEYDKTQIVVELVENEAQKEEKEIVY
ncbi:hypothetical protein FQN54_007633 [Arachnomyces sp. PD_36]|nr:hypothetical protein FQN54_007633 [Arachnomyces sp. PD_36]